MKKYIIEMNERQARLLSYVCDTFPRLVCGQDRAYQDLFEEAWKKRCKKATGKMMDDEFEGGWQKMREDAETFCKEIKRRFWNLPPNASYGVTYDDTADIIWDIHQCLRYELWLNRDEPKPHSTVDAFPACQFGKEPLVKVTSKDEDNETD